MSVPDGVFEAAVFSWGWWWAWRWQSATGSAARTRASAAAPRRRAPRTLQHARTLTHRQPSADQLADAFPTDKVHQHD